MDCKNQTANLKRCTCTYQGCLRHGVCCECVAYHKALGELPGCFFSAGEELTYDRSISAFVAARR
jgi:hypothetical protein